MTPVTVIARAVIMLKNCMFVESGFGVCLGEFEFAVVLEIEKLDVADE